MELNVIFHTAFLLNFLFNVIKTETFEEKLFIKPLSTGHVYTHFKFTVQKDLLSDSVNTFHHFRLFPRSLGEIISEYNVQEMHFSLTQGFWRYEKWGYPIRDSPPGAELWAVFKGKESDVSSNWKKLTNILSGQFCASLNFIDDSTTVTPKLSFKPEGAVELDRYDSNFTRYSSLPPEIVCTENLTPFRKILPCGYQAGLTTLLNALNVFNAHFVSLAIDVQTICNKKCSEIAIQLVHSVAVVFDLPVDFRKQDWSFVKLFGSHLTNHCPVATNSKVYVDITSNKTGIPFTLSIKPDEIINENFGGKAKFHKKEVFAVYDLKSILSYKYSVNIAAIYEKNHIHGIIPPPVLYVDRKLSGYGQEHGGIFCTFFNNHPTDALKIIYFDLIPWYIRLYSHTLILKNGNETITPDYLYYVPAKDRSRPHHLEVLLTLPPKSKTEMRIEFDFAFLKWTEYPPDANHGFYIGPAVISAVLDSNKNFSYFPGEEKLQFDLKRFLRIHTKILLVSLPTPDFSMPYNVICLTCTVVALAFGPIHNITTRILVPVDESEENKITSKIKKYLKKWWSSNRKNSTEVKEEDKFVN